ncbi:MAG TPA: hypothetical protein VK116_03975, partial [Planctomycetota bacterium]|nr:hypothetical protein [Planctomycetota bacterium]
LVGVIYPDNDRVRYVYGSGSYIERIDGGAGGRVVLASAEHEATGQVRSLRFGNGTETIYAYDRSDRLIEIETRSPSGDVLLSHTLSYDPASNVIGIDDGRSTADVPADSPRRVSVSYEYDDLHRLVRARYGSSDGSGIARGEIEYEHDAIGNLLA